MLATRRLDEQTKLSEAVQQHMQLQAGQASMQSLLHKYVEAGVDELGLLLRQEHRPVQFSARCIPCLAMGCQVCSGALVVLSSSDLPGLQRLPTLSCRPIEVY